MADNIKSITRARAEKSRKAKDWTVKDALEYALELLEKGEIGESDLCVITIAEKADNDGDRLYHYINAVPDNLTATGLMGKAMKYFVDGQ